MKIYVISHDTRRNGVGDMNGEIFKSKEEAFQAIEKEIRLKRDDSEEWDSDGYCDAEDNINILEKEI